MAIEVARAPGRAGRAPTRWSSTSATAAPGHRHHGRPARTSSPARATWAARCAWAPYPAKLRDGLDRGARRTASTDGRPSGTGTGTRSTTPTATRWPRPGWCISGTSPDGRLVEFVELDRERAPVLRGHPGAPGVQEPARPGRTRCSPAFVARGAWTTHAADRLPVDAGAGRQPMRSRHGRVTRDDASRRPRSTRPGASPSSERFRGADVQRRHRRGRRCPAAASAARDVRACTPARSAVVALDDDGPGACWSASTGTRSARCCGSCRPGCSTSTARTRLGDRAAGAGRGGRPASPASWRPAGRPAHLARAAPTS